MSKETVQIPPSPRLAAIIGATSLGPAEAIAEIVANSLDAAIDGQNAVIDIDVDDYVVVIDNGQGMQKDILVQALRLGMDMDAVVKKKERKGHFGLGMKTACASLGHWWGIYTRPVGEKKEYRVFFDLRDWSKREKAGKGWTIEVETIDRPDDGPLESRPHGTAIFIKQLKSNVDVGPINYKLGQAFKGHLNSGDKININTTPVTSKPYNIIDGSRTNINHSFEFEGDEYTVTGWFGIDKQTHNEGEFGFNIYRQKQLIQAWNQDWFSAHLMTSRIMGEVDLDFIDANFFKMGIQAQTHLWQKVCQEMRDFLKPLVSASREISRGPKSDKKNKDAIKKMRENMGLSTENPVGGAGSRGTHGPGDGEDDSHGAEPDNGNEKAAVKPPIITVSDETIILEDGTKVHIIFVEENIGSEMMPWDYLYDQDAKELHAIVNTNSLLHEKSKDKKLIKEMVISDAIMQFLINEQDLPLKKALSYRYEHIFRFLSK